MTRLTWLVCLLSISSVSCIKFYRPGEKGGAAASEAKEPAKAAPAPDFKKEQAKLDEARKHLEAEAWQERRFLVGSLSRVSAEGAS